MFQCPRIRRDVFFFRVCWESYLLYYGMTGNYILTNYHCRIHWVRPFRGLRGVLPISTSSRLSIAVPGLDSNPSWRNIPFSIWKRIFQCLGCRIVSAINYLGSLLTYCCSKDFSRRLLLDIRHASSCHRNESIQYTLMILSTHLYSNQRMFKIAHANCAASLTVWQIWGYSPNTRLVNTNPSCRAGPHRVVFY